jgi:hypothetical protein
MLPNILQTLNAKPDGAAKYNFSPLPALEEITAFVLLIALVCIPHIV